MVGSRGLQDLRVDFVSVYRVNLILIVGVVFFFSCFSQAADITLEWLPSPRTLSTHGLTTRVFRITNLQASADTFRLEFIMPEGFATLTAPTSVELAAGEGKMVFVRLFAGPVVPAGSYEISLRVQSETNPTQFAEAQTTVAVEQGAGEEDWRWVMVPATIKGTCSWKNDTLSSTVDLRMGGTIAKGKTLTLGGKFNIGVNEGLSLQNGWMKYGEPDWKLSIGGIAFPGAVTTDTITIEYHYTPEGSPYSAKYYRNTNRSSLDFTWKWNALSFGVGLSNGDFTVSSSINTNTIKMELKIKESGFTLSLTPPSCAGFSLSGSVASNSGETTISFSPACGPFSGKLSFALSEATKKTMIAPQFTTSIAGGWKLKGSLKLERKRGESVHTFGSGALFCVSHSGSAFSGSLTANLAGSSDLLTGVENNTLTVQGKSTFRFDLGWSVSLDTTLSQRLGTTDEPTNSVKVGFSMPFHNDSWRANLKLELATSQEGKASFSVSAQGMSLEVSASRSSFSLSLGAQFNTLLPFINTKG